MEQPIEIAQPEQLYHQAIEYSLKDNSEEAHEKFSQAAAQGFLAADLWLYSLDTENEQQRNKAEQAYEWLLQQDQSQPWVQNDLGFCYKDGIGVEQNSAQAIAYYEEAANVNYLPALLNLRSYYSKGSVKDLEKAFDYAKRAADLNHAESWFYMGLCFEKGEVIDEEAQEGDSLKSAAAGIITKREKQQSSIKNYPGAFYYYQLAAEQRHAEAQYRLALLYANGQGVIANQQQANYYFHLAAQQGHEKAQIEAAKVTDDKAYESNFQNILNYLTLPLNFHLTAAQHAIQTENTAQTYEALAEQIKNQQVDKSLEDLLASLRIDEAEEEKNAKTIQAATKLAENFNAQAAELRKKAQEPCLGVLKAATECQLHTFKFRFYQNDIYDHLQPRKLATLEENLIAALCHSQGFSGCEKNNHSAIGYYRKALELAKNTGLSSATIEAAKLLAKQADGIEAISTPNPYETIANTLLYELVNYYMQVSQADRTGLNLAEQTRLDDKQAALQVLIPQISESLTTFLEHPNQTNEQALLEILKVKNIHECLWEDLTFWPIVGNIVIGLTGIGLIAMGVNYAMNDRFLFFREVIGGTTGKLEESVKELGSAQSRSV